MIFFRALVQKYNLFQRSDEVTQRRLDILSDFHVRWQQLQEEIASDGGRSIYQHTFMKMYVYVIVEF